MRLGAGRQLLSVPFLKPLFLLEIGRHSGLPFFVWVVLAGGDIFFSLLGVFEDG